MTTQRESVSIALPFPPSLHILFKRHNGSHMSEKYRAWRDEAGWLLKSQKPTPIAGEVSVCIRLVNPNRIRRDASNHIKAVEDLLVAHGIIEADDDRTVRSITAMWVSEGEPCVVTVEAVNASA